MSNVLSFNIDPDIVLPESSTVGMSDSIKGNLLACITMATKKYKCHWTNLAWSVKMVDNERVISVKKKL